MFKGCICPTGRQLNRSVIATQKNTQFWGTVAATLLRRRYVTEAGYFAV